MIRRNSFLIAGIAMIILCLPLLAGATAPQRIAYQGRLTDVAGNPIPDNPSLSVTFNIYPTDVGPGSIWTETQSVAVKSGLFSAELGAITSLTNTVFTDSVRWLGVTVGGTELTPRTRLISAAYSYRVATVDNADAGNLKGNLNVSGTINSGSATGTGRVDVYLNGSASPVISATQLAGHGGMIRLYDEAASNIGQFEADGNGTGAYFEIDRGDGTRGLEVDGNYTATGEPRVTIFGTTQTAAFRMDQTGDAAVVLPVDAVDASEMLDEPGAASAIAAPVSAIVLTGPTQTLVSRTITMPAAGYVLAIGTCQPQVVHATGTTTSAQFGVSTSSSVWPSNQDIGILLPGALPTGTYNWPVTAQTVFTLGAGVNTVYFLASKGIGGTINTYDIQLSLIYIPTSYGTVSTLAGAAMPDDDITTPVTLGAPDLEAERAESIESNNARIARELAAMKAELEVVKKQLKQENQDNQRD